MRVNFYPHTFSHSYHHARIADKQRDTENYEGMRVEFASTLFCFYNSFVNLRNLHQFLL